MLPSQQFPPVNGHVDGVNGSNGISAAHHNQQQQQQHPGRPQQPPHQPQQQFSGYSNLNSQFSNVSLGNPGPPAPQKVFSDPNMQPRPHIPAFRGSTYPQVPQFNPQPPQSSFGRPGTTGELPKMPSFPRVPQFAPPTSMHNSASLPALQDVSNLPGGMLGAGSIPGTPQLPMFGYGAENGQRPTFTGQVPARPLVPAGIAFPQRFQQPPPQLQQPIAQNFAPQQNQYENGFPQNPPLQPGPLSLNQFSPQVVPHVQDQAPLGPSQGMVYSQQQYSQPQQQQFPAPGFRSPQMSSTNILGPQQTPFMGQTAPPAPGMFPIPGQPSIQPVGFPGQQNVQNPGMSGQTMTFDGSAGQPEGGRVVNLLHSRKIFPAGGIELPKPPVRQDPRQMVNCSPDVFRCTLNAIPKTPALLQKSRLPLGILIHPFKDLSNLQVLSCTTIVRCRACRSYINPFVTFVDQHRWKCNLCERTNDLPNEFYHDPVTHTVGDPMRRPEVRTATIEYIAPQEYSLRPPQPAVYVFLLDISFNAIESRYLEIFCERLSHLLDRLPGDARTQIALIAFDSGIHFFQLEGDWRMLTVADIEDVFVPTTDGILIRMHEDMAAVKDLLNRLPSMFKGQRETHSCMGAAIQIAHKLVAPSGGRITIFQTCLPTVGPGALKSREDPNMRAAKEVKNLQPATDFYKTLALECSGNQVAVDLFLLAGQYADLASISGIARYSGGSIHFYPGFNVVSNVAQVERFESELTRYLSRKIGFEAVMRVRCTNGLSMHSFHGNFFVRSTDLLSLPNINPDAGFAVQVKMDDSLSHVNSVCFQAALLYTSSKGERRIRVHTLYAPVTESLAEVFACADQEAIVCIVAKIAAERALSHPIADVRDGVVFSCEDALTAYTQLVRPQTGQFLAPYSLRLLPLLTQSLLKNMGLRVGVSTTLDLRTYFLLTLKAGYLSEAMLCVYPHLYPVHDIVQVAEFLNEDDAVPKLDRLHLSYENIEQGGAYLLDAALHMILYVTKNVGAEFCRDVLGVASYKDLADRSVELPELDTEASAKLRAFIGYRHALRPLHPVLEIVKEESKDRLIFLQYLHDDRLESTGSYYEFITQMSQKIKAT